MTATATGMCVVAYRRSVSQTTKPIARSFFCHWTRRQGLRYFLAILQLNATALRHSNVVSFTVELIFPSTHVSPSVLSFHYILLFFSVPVFFGSFSVYLLCTFILSAQSYLLVIQFYFLLLIPQQFCTFRRAHARTCAHTHVPADPLINRPARVIVILICVESNSDLLTRMRACAFTSSAHAQFQSCLRPKRKSGKQNQIFHD